MTEAELRARIVTALARPQRPSSDYDLNRLVDSRDTDTRRARALRPAAVLVGLLPRACGLHIVLTKRSSALKHHPGQVAFPGGKIDPSDADATAAALREAEEEVGLRRDQVEPLGLLAPHETVTGYSIAPVVALITGAFTPRPEPGEVAEVFSAPLAHCSDPARFMIQSRVWRGRPRRYFTVPYGPYYIWGATARILRGLADGLAP